MIRAEEARDTPIPVRRVCAAKVVEADRDGWILDGDLIAFYDDGTYQILKFSPLSEEQMKAVVGGIKSQVETRKLTREKLFKKFGGGTNA